MNALTETSKNLSSNKNIESALSVNQLLIDKSNSENIIITSQEISVLERELLMKIEDLCHFKIRRIVDQYFLKKAGKLLFFKTIFRVNQSLLFYIDCKKVYVIEFDCFKNKCGIDFKMKKFICRFKQELHYKADRV